MKVLIVNNAVPFAWGGAEELALNLAREINARKGLEAEVMRVPFAWQPKERLVSEILLNRSLNIHNADRVIALKFPAYYVNHHAKTIWLLHQFRQAYDLLDNGQSFLSREADGDILTAIREADNACFDSAQKVFANSPVTKGRLKTYNGRDCEVLYPPLNDAGLFEPGSMATTFLQAAASIPASDNTFSPRLPSRLARTANSSLLVPPLTRPMWPSSRLSWRRMISSTGSAFRSACTAARKSPPSPAMRSPAPTFPSMKTALAM